MVIMKTIAFWQFLLLTKFKICTVLPRNIMAVYEEDNLHCYRSITSKFCLTATYRCLCFELYFWNSSKLLAVVELFSWKRTTVLPSMRVKVLETGHHTSFRLKCLGGILIETLHSHFVYPRCALCLDSCLVGTWVGQ